MDFKITAPNKNFTGESAGVNFVNGKGITKDGKNADWFRKKGYKVEPIKHEEETEGSKTPEPPKEPKDPKTSKPPKGQKDPEVGDVNDSSGNSSE